MKKSLLVIVLLYWSTLSLAQKIEVGIKGGLNLSKFDQLGDQLLTGINAGAYALVKVGKIKIQPELLYSQQGAIEDVTFISPIPPGSLAVKTHFTTNLNYLNIPVLLKMKLVGGLHFLVGPQVGIILAAKNHASTNGTNAVTEDIKKSVNTDFSAVAGFAYQFPLGISIDARYLFGMTSIGYFSDKNRVIRFRSAIGCLNWGFKFYAMHHGYKQR